MNCSPPGSSVQARLLEWVAIPFSRGSSWPRDWTQVSCLAGRFFTNWARREAQTKNRKVTSDSLWPHGLYGAWNSPSQNTGLGNLLLLWGIFPTQGLNPGHSHCRQILYQLSHRGNPKPDNLIKKMGRRPVQTFFLRKIYRWLRDAWKDAQYC